MIPMRMNELRSLSTEALNSKLRDLRLDLGIERRTIKSTGVASKKIKTGEMRRTVAQILTLLKERGVKSA